MRVSLPGDQHYLLQEAPRTQGEICVCSRRKFYYVPDDGVEVAPKHVSLTTLTGKFFKCKHFQNFS
jgi:hypothetical protein